MAQETPTAALTDTTTPPTGKGARPRLTYAQRALILGARKANPDISVDDVARIAGCSRSQAYRILTHQDGTAKSFTHDLLQTALTERLDDWARAARTAAHKGYHQPAKDWLIAAKAIDEPKVVLPTGGPSVTVNLAFALPGVPTQPAITSPTTARTPQTTAPQNTAQALDIDTVAIPAQLLEPDAIPTPSPAPLLHKANPCE